MPSERMQRQIDFLLDQAEEALRAEDWGRVRDLGEKVLVADPENADAKTLIAMAGGDSSGADTGLGSAAVPFEEATPHSFAGGRYRVRDLLGEGSKKRVYLAHDELLDRDVAFALIKTEGLDEVGRERIAREAQAMGRLRSHPHVVSVFDLGQHEGQTYIVPWAFPTLRAASQLPPVDAQRQALARTDGGGRGGTVLDAVRQAHAAGLWREERPLRVP